MFSFLCFFFFFNDTATTEIYTLSLHDALPISAIYAGIAGIELMLETGVEETRAHVQDLNHRLLEGRSEEHTSELQSRLHLVCRLLLEKKKKKKQEKNNTIYTTEDINRRTHMTQ